MGREWGVKEREREGEGEGEGEGVEREEEEREEREKKREGRVRENHMYCNVVDNKGHWRTIEESVSRRV